MLYFKFCLLSGLDPLKVLYVRDFNYPYLNRHFLLVSIYYCLSFIIQSYFQILFTLNQRKCRWVNISIKNKLELNKITTFLISPLSLVINQSLPIFEASSCFTLYLYLSLFHLHLNLFICPNLPCPRLPQDLACVVPCAWNSFIYSLHSLVKSYTFFRCWSYHHFHFLRKPLIFIMTESRQLSQFSGIIFLSFEACNTVVNFTFIADF